MTPVPASQSIPDGSIAQLHSIPAQEDFSGDIRSDEGVERLVGGTGEENGKQRARISQAESVLPSPPLTRSNSEESERAPAVEALADPALATPTEATNDDQKTGQNAGADVHDGVEKEQDLADLHLKPHLGLHHAPSEDSLLDSNGRLRTPSQRTSEGIQLRTVTNPQPWDLVQPPSDNGHHLPGPYGTVKSNFSQVQSARSKTLIPKSSYYFGPPPPGSAYGTQPIGQIGVHHPREVVRVERDYSGGELIQFAPIYPLELDGRITPTQFLESINAINERLISAHSLRWAALDNVLALMSLQVSRLVLPTHYEKEMKVLEQLFRELNTELYNPVGLNLLWPRKVAFLFLEIEYY